MSRTVCSHFWLSWKDIDWTFKEEGPLTELLLYVWLSGKDIEKKENIDNDIFFFSVWLQQKWKEKAESSWLQKTKISKFFFLSLFLLFSHFSLTIFSSYSLFDIKFELKRKRKIFFSFWILVFRSCIFSRFSLRKYIVFIMFSFLSIFFFLPNIPSVWNLYNMIIIQQNQLQLIEFCCRHIDQ